MILLVGKRERERERERENKRGVVRGIGIVYCVEKLKMFDCSYVCLCLYE